MPVRPFPFRTAPRLACLALSMVIGAACSNIVPVAGDNGPVPLDSARAVALARRNVCSVSAAAADSLCPVVGHELDGSTHVVTLERRRPAGPGDRVRVRLRDHGMRVEVEPLPDDE